MGDQKVEWSEALNAVEDGITIIDIKYNILRANNAVAKNGWCLAGRVANKKCFEAVHGSDLLLSSCPLVKTLKTKKGENQRRFWH